MNKQAIIMDLLDQLEAVIGESGARRAAGKPAEDEMEMDMPEMAEEPAEEGDDLDARLAAVSGGGPREEMAEEPSEEPMPADDEDDLDARLASVSGGRKG